MAIKVGNSWVTEASYARAKANIDSENKENSEQVTVESLGSKFPGTNFSTNTAPYSGTGVNNIAISPNILSQMSSDPEKRLEYEALIMDCIDLQKSFPERTQSGSKIKDSGFIINSDGSLSAWCITEPSGASSGKKHITELYKDKKESWLDTILKDMDSDRSLNMKI